MKISLVSRRVGGGEGASGYAARLLQQLQQRHQVRVLGGEGLARLSWMAIQARRRGEIVLSLERILNADVYRAGGGVHVDAMRAIRKRRIGRTSMFEAGAIRSARIVVANSKFVADGLRRRGCERVCVVRTGVDLRRFADVRRVEGQRVVLFAGHGWRRKGFAAAVAAVAALRDVRLWVAGRDGGRRRRLRRARALLGNRMLDLGPSIDVQTYLSRVDVVLQPTLYDAASNLVLEGMAAGVPVITTTADGSSEVVPFAQLVVPPNDHTATVRALQYALSESLGLQEHLRAAAKCWPDSRNAAELEALMMRSTYV